MSLLGPHRLAVILCKCSDQPQEPQPPVFFEALFSRNDPRQWSTPFWILNPNFQTAVPGGGVAAVARTPDQLDVFWAGGDGAIWTNWWNAALNQGAWNTPFPITPPGIVPPGAAVAAVARKPGHLDVFWADNGGAVGSTWWDADDPIGAWAAHSPFRISGANVVPPGAPVAAVARRPDHLDVFWADNFGAVGSNWWDAADPAGAWDKHPAFQITDAGTLPPGAGVAAVARQPDHLDVFWADKDGAIGTNWWDANVGNGQWRQHPAFLIGDAGVAPPGAHVAALARRPDHLDVFWVDKLGAVTTHWWDGNDPAGGWKQHPAFRISAAKAADAGAWVAAVARFPDQLDVFWADESGAIRTNWWNPASNNGQWNIPFAITGPNTVPRGAAIAVVGRFPEHLDVFWADDLRGIGTGFWPSPSRFGLAQYWSDNSYGQFSLDATILGWFPMALTSAQFLALKRQGMIDAGVSAAAAAGVHISDYFTAVVAPNVVSDSGSSGGKTILDPLAWTLGWAAHETGHDLGLDHSFDDNPVSCSPNNDGRPGAYGDGWDIMSFACFGGNNPLFSTPSTFGSSGPALNAPYRDALGWIPADRILEVTAGNRFDAAVTLAALNHPEAKGFLMAKLFTDAGDRSRYYTVEFRMQEGWDAGIARHTVLVHQVIGGLSFLIRGSGGPERLPGHHLDVFWPDKGQAIASNWWDGDVSSAAWSTPFQIGGTGVVPEAAGVAAVSRYPNHLDVFWADRGGAIGTNWRDGADPNGAWAAPSAFRISDPQVVPPGAGVAALARYRDHLDVFWANNWGAIATNWWDAFDPDGAWDKHAAFEIGDRNVVPPGGQVAAVARTPDHLDVFWIDTAGAVATHWWDAFDPNGAWSRHSASRISATGAAPAGASVAAVSRLPNHLDVFWAGSDHAIWTTWWDAGFNQGQWSTPFRITAPGVAQPGAGIAAVARFSGHLDVFWADQNGAIRTQWWDAQDPNGDWDKHSSFPITAPGTARSGAPVAAAARHPSHLDVFWADQNGAIEGHWWDAVEPGGGWDQHPTVRIADNGNAAPSTGVAVVARYPDEFLDPTRTLSVRVSQFDIVSSTATVQIVLA